MTRVAVGLLDPSADTTQGIVTSGRRGRRSKKRNKNKRRMNKRKHR